MDSASQVASARRRELCRYYAAGRCFRGQSCKFSHDQAASARVRRQRAPHGVCHKFFYTGACNRANTAAGCKYRHERPRTSNATTASSSTPQTRSSLPARQRPTGDSFRDNNPQPSVAAAIPATGSLAAVPVPPTAVPVPAATSQQNSRAPTAPTPQATLPRPPATQNRTLTTVSSPQTAVSSQLSRPSQSPEHRRIGDTLSRVHSLRAGAVSRAHSRGQPAVSQPVANVENDTCAICFDEPAMYGLLCQCRHVFCWRCINSWRSSDQATAKNCPVCRVHSCHHVISETFIAGDKDAGRRLKQQLFARQSCHVYTRITTGRAAYAPSAYRPDSWWDDPPPSSFNFVPAIRTSMRPASQADPSGTWPNSPYMEAGHQMPSRPTALSSQQAQVQRSTTVAVGQTPRTTPGPTRTPLYSSELEVLQRRQQEQQRRAQMQNNARPGALAAVAGGITAAVVAAYRWWRPG